LLTDPASGKTWDKIIYNKIRQLKTDFNPNRRMQIL
jgi:hypothetical protein